MPQKPFPKRNYAARSKPAAATAWERQAGWYDAHQGEGGDDFYQQLILPTVLRRLAAQPGQTVLDVCCGNGVLGRALAAQGVHSIGVDASPSLVAAARERAGTLERHVVGDARHLAGVLHDRGLDHAALVMALQDLDQIQGVAEGIATLLKPGGRVVMALTHPCFRIPRRSTVAFDEQYGVQYRRIEAYLSPFTAPIRTHPGMADSASTDSFHRPLGHYVEAFGRAGFGIIGMDELGSHRRGTKGPRYGAEDIYAREIPLFLVLTAVKLRG